MRTNGFLYPLSLCEDPGAYVSFDENGVPCVSGPSPDETGEGVPCWAECQTDDSTASYEDGEFRRLAFTALTEKPFAAALCRLEKDGEDLGRFRVWQRQQYKRMGRCRVWLKQ